MNFPIHFGSLRRFRFGLACTVASALLAAASQAHGLTLACPPLPSAGPAMPVPGKAGETGWLLATKTDDMGNTVQIYCLQPLKDVHDGPDFAQMYTPKGDKAVWVGACLFFRGKNRFTSPSDDTDDGMGGGKPNGKPDKFKKVTWFNQEPAPDGTNDWDFSYDTMTKKLTINKTEGMYVDELDPKTGTTKKVYKYKIVDTETVDPPEVFGDLKFKGIKIAASARGDGTSDSAFAALVDPPAAPGHWDITLHAIAQGGSGTTADPYNGLPAEIFAGDTFTLGGVGLTNPAVDGLAATAAYGAWTVSDFASDFVIFMATVDASFLPGTDLPSFRLTSDGTRLNWILVSANDGVSSSGAINIPEAGSLWLVLIALASLGYRRARVEGLASPGQPNRLSATPKCLSWM